MDGAEFLTSSSYRPTHIPTALAYGGEADWLRLSIKNDKQCGSTRDCPTKPAPKHRADFGKRLSNPFPKYGVVFRALVGQASRLSFWTGKMPVPPEKAHDLGAGLALPLQRRRIVIDRVRCACATVFMPSRTEDALSFTVCTSPYHLAIARVTIANVQHRLECPTGAIDTTAMTGVPADDFPGLDHHV